MSCLFVRVTFNYYIISNITFGWQLAYIQTSWNKNTLIELLFQYPVMVVSDKSNVALILQVNTFLHFGVPKF